MSKRLVSLLLLFILAFVVAGAARDTPSLTSYPVIVTSTAFVLTALTVLPMTFRQVSRGSPSFGTIFGRTAQERRQMARIVAFCLVWLLYIVVLNRLGFVLASSLALVASLWITLGRFRLLASLSAVIFVLALAILVTTVLFVPVPKAGLDYWIDETIYTLLEK
ncbi:tripartite tricarboxylate transporter TctB family protein [Pseudochelatococcus sp. B33]